MKVLLVFTFGYSLKTWSDSGTLYKELEIYKVLFKKYNIEFLFITYGDESDLEIDLSEYGIKVFPVYLYIKKYRSKFLNYLFSFLLPFKLIKEETILSEVNLIKQNQLLGSWVSLLLKKNIKKPLFLRTGYDMYKFSKEEKKNLFVIFLYKMLTKLSFKFSDLYSVSSESDLNFFKKQLRLNGDKLVYRPNFISKKIIKHTKNRYQDRILCVGRLEEQKNFKFIIQEFSNTDFMIDIVGDGSQKSYLSQFAKKNNTKINFLGKLSNEDLNNLYQKYNFFVNASFFEGSPKTVLEAMANECLVFVSNIPNHTEIISHLKNGYVFNIESSSLKNLVLDSKNIDQNILKSNALKRIEIDYSIEKAIEIEYQDYKNLIS